MLAVDGSSRSPSRTPGGGRRASRAKSRTEAVPGDNDQGSPGWFFRAVLARLLVVEVDAIGKQYENPDDVGTGGAVGIGAGSSRKPMIGRSCLSAHDAERRKIGQGEVKRVARTG